ncbi:FkbM family methyltransferase [Microscilla marina]|uniref:Methyltransferase, FkbM family protein n=1 Tax=Microscilla marina ATCC 23134 TaxID=313606 RepID=A1ZTP6_MICM2|nr:FkbM family methyltransferase [Microscilla marina]EAY26306.1 methyltransferase, FkbM family protein [Microscilla marina ATCC 23134]
MNIKFLEFIGRKLRPIELALLLKYFFRIKRRTFTLADQRSYYIDPISDLGLRLQKQQMYEPEMSKVIAEILEDGDTFIDLGSNEGYFAILGGEKCGSSGKVYAIEPQARLWGIITKNVLLNNLTNVHLLPYGVGAEKQELVLQLYPSVNSGASSFSPKFNFKISFGWLRKKIYGTQNSKIVILDSLLPVISDTIKLIKIDIEGFEYEALKGASEMLKRQLLQYILIEIHPDALKGMKQSESDIDELLSSCGYSKDKISDNLNLYTIQ